MFFTCRGDELPLIPKLGSWVPAIDNFISELRGFHGYFADCFSRSEPRENFFRYMIGQFSQLDRKSIESIAVHVAGGEVRSMQRFVSDAVWNEKLMLKKYHYLVDEDMGDEEGVCLLAEASFVKKGDDSAGVAKQFCGETDKVANCQVGLFAAYASRHGYALVDKRLFIPELWFGEVFRVRREKCKVPHNLEHNNKSRLAVEMLEELWERATLPFRYVATDCLWGNSADFINCIEKLAGLVYFVSVNADTFCWLEPAAVEKEGFTREALANKHLMRSQRKPATVQSLAESLSDFFWYRRKITEGSKGTIEYEFVKRRIVLAASFHKRWVWLIIRRTIGISPSYSFFISNAPENTRLARFVWLSGMHWAAEQCLEEARDQLGMAHYEVRKYSGWNRHMLTSMLAHFFLWHMQIRLGQKSSVYYGVTFEEWSLNT
ncbi:MAG: IS701 family transposase [Desulforhabdus sp.]|jgi:SRSO17 transposase|nr:IS701 family transposase [Desulforhabdus sp.]